MAVKKSIQTFKKKGSKVLPIEQIIKGIHMVFSGRNKKEFQHYSYKNGNQIGWTESYKRREGVYNALLSMADIFNPGQDAVTIHDHTQKEYRKISVRRKKDGSRGFDIEVFPQEKSVEG